MNYENSQKIREAAGARTRALPEWATREMVEAYLLDLDGARQLLNES